LEERGRVEDVLNYKGVTPNWFQPISNNRLEEVLNIKNIKYEKYE
jgi:hypothetical protein